MKRQRTPQQIEADKLRMAKVRAARKEQVEEQVKVEEPPVDTQDKPDFEAMQRQIDEVMETNALLKAALLKNSDTAGPTLGQDNRVVGEIDKYLIDPANYPDPTKRLAQEKRLETIAFNHNYELNYSFSIRPYKSRGINFREPEFLITLYRVVLDDQGNRVKVLNPVTKKPEDKFFIARRLMLHEDPEAALVMARDNNLDIDKSDEKTFLDEMRYLRIRDWLFDYFWPLGSDPAKQIHEEVIAGTVVQVFTKSSQEPEEIDFNAIKTKLSV